MYIYKYPALQILIWPIIYILVTSSLSNEEKKKIYGMCLCLW